MPETWRPNSDLVAVSWLGQKVTGLAPAYVGGTLPAKSPLGWLDTGFVQASTVAGRSADVDTGRRVPVVQLDTWAAPKAAGGVPPWALAAHLLELVLASLEGNNHAWRGKPLTCGPNYSTAIVWGVYPLTEVVKITGDPSGYARFTLDLGIDWAHA